MKTTSKIYKMFPSEGRFVVVKTILNSFYNLFIITIIYWGMHQNAEFKYFESAIFKSVALHLGSEWKKNDLNCGANDGRSEIRFS